MSNKIFLELLKWLEKNGSCRGKFRLETETNSKGELCYRLLEEKKKRGHREQVCYWCDMGKHGYWVMRKDGFYEKGGKKPLKKRSEAISFLKQDIKKEYPKFLRNKARLLDKQIRMLESKKKRLEKTINS